MYPPAPWNLQGQLYLSVFLLPARGLPALDPGLRPVTVAGRVPVGAAWVDYEPGGVLDYRELLTAVLLRGRRQTITHIWVDSPASRDGGRALWAIPKDLAVLKVSPPLAVAETIASATIRPGRRLPGRWPTPLTVVQKDITTRVRGRAAVRATRITWDVDEAGPLSWLAGRRPLFSLTLADFRLRFGG
ncbi:acetoacetate decarboxylase [Winogradskya humida]|uniref:Acetoacetate decarboxylase n=1 Tax=Winogradskya humida TaxID=113566 RepID=A0ABQ3ZZN8_9ACTN|nr:acetoacetate decarboxylase [Actinoplanes humidus]GIE24089.1 acetoacetate decarboxylase [Actinoplanes humidus]